MEVEGRRKDPVLTGQPAQQACEPQLLQAAVGQQVYVLLHRPDNLSFIPRSQRKQPGKLFSDHALATVHIRYICTHEVGSHRVRYTHAVDSVLCLA